MSITYPLKPIQIRDFQKKHGSDIEHGFFTREGGVSEDMYEGLNCGLGSKDDPAAVKENISLVKKSFATGTLHIPVQTHSDVCQFVTLDDSDEKRFDADALVTKTPHIAIGILTADCAPVLMAGRTADKKPVVAAAHAGWEGAFGGILENTVQCMVDNGAVLSSISATIGPAIQQKTYQVGRDFYERFLFDDAANDHFFKLRQYNDLYFDLPGYAAMRLGGAGITNVILTGHNTYDDEDLFFSYRRSTHREESDYGRQISAIMIVK